VTNDDVLYRSRLRLFALAREMGSVRAACRMLGVHHSTYYLSGAFIASGSVELAVILMDEAAEPRSVPDRTLQDGPATLVALLASLVVEHLSVADRILVIECPAEQVLPERVELSNSLAAACAAAPRLKQELADGLPFTARQTRHLAHGLAPDPGLVHVHELPSADHAAPPAATLAAFEEPSHTPVRWGISNRRYLGVSHRR
jgi:hypothetical protein